MVDFIKYMILIFLSERKSNKIRLKFKTSIANGCIFYGVDNIFLNFNVSIGRNSLFSAEKGIIRIGKKYIF